MDNRVIEAFDKSDELCNFNTSYGALESYKRQVEKSTNQSQLTQAIDTADFLKSLSPDQMKPLTPEHVTVISGMEESIVALIKEKQAGFRAEKAENSRIASQRAARLGELGEVYQHMAKLVGKKDQLCTESLKTKKNSFISAYWAMDTVHYKLNAMVNDYLIGKTNKEEFKKAAKDYFDSSPAEIQTLKQHRGIKQILTNILTAILTLGVGYAIGAACKHTWNFFPVATDSAKKVDALRNSIENLPASPILNGAV